MIREFDDLKKNCSNLQTAKNSTHTSWTDSTLCSCFTLTTCSTSSKKSRTCSKTPTRRRSTSFSASAPKLTTRHIRCARLRSLQHQRAQSVRTSSSTTRTIRARSRLQAKSRTCLQTSRSSSGRVFRSALTSCFGCSNLLSD